MYITYLVEAEKALIDLIKEEVLYHEMFTMITFIICLIPN